MVPSSFCQASAMGAISDWAVVLGLGSRLLWVGLVSLEPEAALFHGSSNNQGAGLGAYQGLKILPGGVTEPAL